MGKCKQEWLVVALHGRGANRPTRPGSREVACNRKVSTGEPQRGMATGTLFRRPAPSITTIAEEATSLLPNYSCRTHFRQCYTIVGNRWRFCRHSATHIWPTLARKSEGGQQMPGTAVPDSESVFKIASKPEFVSQ